MTVPHSWASRRTSATNSARRPGSSTFVARSAVRTAPERFSGTTRATPSPTSTSITGLPTTRTTRRVHSPVGQEPRGEIGRREMQRGAGRGNQPVHLLHRRRVERTQSCLQVRDGNPVASRREAKQRHGVRVSEDEDEVGPVACQCALCSFQDCRDAGGRIRRQRPRLVRMHVQLVEERGAHSEITVLTGGDHPDRRARRRDFPDDRCEFDYLWSRSQGNENARQPSKTSSK